MEKWLKEDEEEEEDSYKKFWRESERERERKDCSKVVGGVDGEDYQILVLRLIQLLYP